MATEADIIKRVRLELGDLGEPFRTTATGDGETDQFNLPVGLISETTFSAYVINGGTITNLTTADYTLDVEGGVLDLAVPLALNATLVAEGRSTSLFTDSELSQFVHDAFVQHSGGSRSITQRYRDTDGFIKYIDNPMTLETLPEVEEYLVSLLATIEALWALTTDASTDIDVSTAEGTHLARSQRYAQMRSQIDVLTEKYHTHCQQLNVGLFRIEVANLRRVSRTTGRLVPLFEEREYDDHRLPTRQLPPIDVQNPDESGVPSPIWAGPFGY